MTIRFSRKKGIDMNKRIRLLAAVLVLCMALTLGLCGCTPKKQESGIDENAVYASTEEWRETIAKKEELTDPVYVADIFSFDHPGVFPVGIQTSPNGLYASVRNRDGEDCVWEFDESGHFLREIPVGNARMIGTDGSYWRYEQNETKGDVADRHTDYILTRIKDGQSEEILRFHTERGTADFFLCGDYFALHKIYWDDDNIGHYSLELYSNDGTLLKTIELDDWYREYPDGDTLYLLNGTSYEFFLVDSTSGSLVKVDKLDEDCKEGAIRGGVLYEMDESAVYRRAVGETGRELLFSFDEVSVKKSMPIPIGGTDAFLLLDFVNTVTPFHIVYPVEKSSIPAERAQIVLAVNVPGEMAEFEPYGDWRSEIYDFNAVSRSYEIVVRNYGTEPDPQTALNVDIAAGSVPDLIDMTGTLYGFTETYDALGREYRVPSFHADSITAANCEDLLPYFERDFGTDALLDGPLRAMTQNGKLLSLIPSFGIDALVGASALLEGAEITSFGDLAELAGGAEHIFWLGVSRESFLRLSFTNSNRDYSAEQVADILILADKLYSENSDTMPLESWYGDELDPQSIWLAAMGDIWSGNQKLDLRTFDSPLWSDRNGGMGAEEAFFREPITVLGFPGSGAFYLEPSKELVMPIQATNKAGAWEFMKFVLNDRYLLNMTFSGDFLSGIPLTKSAYEKGMAAYREMDPGRISASGAVSEEIILPYDSTNCFAQFERLVDKVSGLCRGPDEIFDAVMNTANSYFAGDKPLEQAADDIAKRLRIYNAEHS